MARRDIRTEIGWTSVERITFRGHDLADELIGKIDFVDMFMLAYSGRRCNEVEKVMVNAILVSVMDHGFTPSSLAARLTYLGAPEAPQAAVAAGLLGAGSVFLGAMEDAAVMLTQIAAGLQEEPGERQVELAAAAHFAAARTAGQNIFGLGHNIHVKGDPRVPALRALSEANHCFGVHWRLMTALEQETGRSGKRFLPMNAAGAIAAIVCDLGLPIGLARGLALIARSAGIVAHLNEERLAPAAKALWDLALRQDERNEVPD